ncbi:MAG TPA: translation elongation factor Ts [Nitrospirae bacterium]|nr:elongation factor Ts [bacterium BMS3Bbin09]HDO66582.1 translation elongation factor Ts [Nitrospirota bacterium]HEW80756.1 translation elongation factor Ts [Nitrospirota bacterium]
MSITAGDIKELREQTGVGMMDCKKALTEANGNLEKALELLRKKGLAMAAKRSSRAASEGLITSYIHMNKIGVLLEVNCETDFVAKTDEFQNFVKDVSMHIAAANPAYVRREEIPADVVEKEKEIYASQVTNKPPQVVEKILEGKIEKFYSESCLLDQVFVKDEEQKNTINDLLIEIIAKLGENIIINRFARFQLGKK